MAIIKAVNSKASIGKAVKYITKDEKTEQKLIHGKDCNPSTAIDEMKATKEIFRKTDGRQYTHLVQSFNPEDNVTPEMAHSIGKKFIDDEKFKGHEVVMATHVDKNHIHNHFIVNSVNFENGKKFHTQKQELERLKQRSNELSREHGLTIPERGDEITSYSQKKYKALEKDFMGKEDSYLVKTLRDVDKALEKATSKDNFIEQMESKGYQVNWSDHRKYITFTTPNGEKVRNSNLEKTFKSPKYSKEGMNHEISRNIERGTDQSKYNAVTPSIERPQPVIENGIGKLTTEGYSGRISSVITAIEEGARQLAPKLGDEKPTSRTENKSASGLKQYPEQQPKRNPETSKIRLRERTNGYER